MESGQGVGAAHRRAAPRTRPLDGAECPQASARVCGVASPPRAPEPSAARAGLQGQRPWFAPDAGSNRVVAVKNKDRTCV